MIAERRLAGCKHDYKRNKSHLTVARTMVAEDNGSLRLQSASPALGRTWRGHGTAAGRPPSFGPRRGRKRANARRHCRAPPSGGPKKARFSKIFASMFCAGTADRSANGKESFRKCSNISPLPHATADDLIVLPPPKSGEYGG